MSALPESRAQKRVLEGLVRWIDEHGIPPTYSELAERLDYAGPSGPQKMLARLEELGLVVRTERSQGVYEPSDEGREFIEQYGEAA